LPELALLEVRVHQYAPALRGRDRDVLGHAQGLLFARGCQPHRPQHARAHALDRVAAVLARLQRTENPRGRGVGGVGHQHVDGLVAIALDRLAAVFEQPHVVRVLVRVDEQRGALGHVADQIQGRVRVVAGHLDAVVVGTVQFGERVGVSEAPAHGVGGGERGDVRYFESDQKLD
jgi:hypothetical protein